MSHEVREKWVPISLSLSGSKKVGARTLVFPFSEGFDIFSELFARQPLPSSPMVSRRTNCKAVALTVLVADDSYMSSSLD
jgi:hypothetical protein